MKVIDFLDYDGQGRGERKVSKVSEKQDDRSLWYHSKWEHGLRDRGQFLSETRGFKGIKLQHKRKFSHYLLNVVLKL